MFGVKQVGDEFGRRRKKVVADRPVYRQRAVTLFEIGGLDEGGEVRGVIDVQVCEEDCIELRHMRTGASELECAAAATVHQNARSAVLQYQVAAGGTSILQLRAAGAENLDLHAFTGATRARGRERYQRNGSSCDQGGDDVVPPRLK